MRYVGIDVSAKTLSVVVRENEVRSECKDFTNDAKGFKILIKYIKSKHKSKKPIKVCLEATGAYHFDCAVFLSKQKQIEVMVVNPKRAKNFSIALSTKGKTDAIDADMLAQFAQRMQFIPWARPSNDCLKLRSYGRKLTSLAKMKAQFKNQLHAMNSSEQVCSDVIESQKNIIDVLEKEIEKLKKSAVTFIQSIHSIKNLFDLLLSIKGIGDTSATQILGELITLSKDMTAKQWVAHAGLNPVECKSGTSVNKKTRISKAGNRYLRHALYMPALSAANNQEYVRGYYWHLIENRNLCKVQALAAIMRKLLHAIHGMFQTGEEFDPSRFYKTAIAKKINPKKEAVITKEEIELVLI